MIANIPVYPVESLQKVLKLIENQTSFVHDFVKASLYIAKAPMFTYMQGQLVHCKGTDVYLHVRPACTLQRHRCLPTCKACGSISKHFRAMNVIHWFVLKHSADHRHLIRAPSARGQNKIAHWPIMCVAYT